jgi:hypothetical protein
VLVHEHDAVDTGTQVGNVDTTGNADGPHLHFAVKKTANIGCGYIAPGHCMSGETFDAYVDPGPLEFIESHSGSSTFSFAVDSLRVNGNIQGSFFDDFAGSSIPSPPNLTCIPPNSVVESSGFLILTDIGGANTLTPGFLVDNCQLGVEAPVLRLNKGAGNSVVTASFRADTPAQGQLYGLQLFTFGTSEFVNVQVTSKATGVSVFAQAGPTNASNSLPVTLNLTGIQRILLRLVFDDATSRVTALFSIDGGTTFTQLAMPPTAQVMTSGSQGIVAVFGAAQLQ